MRFSVNIYLNPLTLWWLVKPILMLPCCPLVVKAAHCVSLPHWPWVCVCVAVWEFLLPMLRTIMSASRLRALGGSLTPTWETWRLLLTTHLRYAHTRTHTQTHTHIHTQVPMWKTYKFMLCTALMFIVCSVAANWLPDSPVHHSKEQSPVRARQ